MQDFDIHVLIEGAGQPVARCGEDSPASSCFRTEGNRGVVGGIAQPEDGERLKGPIEEDSSRRTAPAGYDVHVRRSCAMRKLAASNWHFPVLRPRGRLISIFSEV